MVGAQSTIVGATEFGAALQRERPIAWLDVILAPLPIGRVGRDQGVLRAVLRAALFIPDLIVPDFNLGRYQRQAGFAQRRRLTPEHVGARSTQGRGHRRFSSAPLRS